MQNYERHPMRTEKRTGKDRQSHSLPAGPLSEVATESSPSI